MKKLLFSLFLAGALVFSSCEKESLPAPNPEPTPNLLADEEPQSLVDSMIATFFDNPMTVEVTATTDAVIEDYPAFIDYDPFTNAVVRRTGSVDSCVRGLELTQSEKEKLNKAFLAKIDCQKANKEIIAKIHREIESWAKTQKLAMYQKYLKTKDSLATDFKTKVSYINGLYDKGTITLEQKNKSLTEVENKYKSDLAALEKNYKSGLELLNSKVKEKIKLSLSRAEACGKIKDCEKIYLQSVLDILGKSKYKKWIECYKYHYRKK